MKTLYQIFNDEKLSFEKNKYEFISDAIFTAQELHEKTGEKYNVMKAMDFTEVWNTTQDIPDELLDF
jgi:hypothetical protein